MIAQRQRISRRIKNIRKIKKGNFIMNLFNLAILQLQREGRGDFSLDLVIDRAIIIRKYLDLQDERREKSQFKKLV